MAYAAGTLNRELCHHTFIPFDIQNFPRICLLSSIQIRTYPLSNTTVGAKLVPYQVTNVLHHCHYRCLYERAGDNGKCQRVK